MPIPKIFESECRFCLLLWGRGSKRERSGYLFDFQRRGTSYNCELLYGFSPWQLRFFESDQMILIYTDSSTQRYIAFENVEGGLKYKLEESTDQENFRFPDGTLLTLS